jgi:hypothetical protein
MRYYIGIVSFLFISCTLHREFLTDEYPSKKFYNIDKTLLPLTQFYLIDIPKGGKVFWISPMMMHIYSYKDLSFIYISDDIYTLHPNDSNIMNLGDSVYKLRFQNRKLYQEINDLLGYEIEKIRSDTFELSGQDDQSLYWKDIVIEDNLCIGYIGVSEENKSLFDKSINTFRKKNNGYVKINRIRSISQYKYRYVPIRGKSEYKKTPKYNN